MITMAADIAAMAPGTNIGAAHPVGSGGQAIEGPMADKVVNDMVASAVSIAERRGRNAEWAEKAVRESVSVTESEALEKKVIDLVAEDLDDLLEKIDGRDIAGKGVLSTRGASVRRLEENFRTKILKIISDPNIAFILMMIGIAGLYFELANPGAVLPGVVGGIAIILAFFAFQTLPVNAAGILLIVLAIVFFILELKVTSYGMLSLAGVLSLLLGSLMLFKSADPAMEISLKVLLPTVLLVSGFFVGVAALVVRSHLSRPMTGSAGLVGEVGVVRQTLAPKGKVFIHGELWQAVAEAPIEAGRKVRVKNVVNLVLEVEEVGDGG
jgi:membrane-bound serine protease (ClpP class)